MSAIRLLLLTMCNAILAYIEMKYPVLGLHVSLANKEQMSQLDGLFAKDELQRMTERRKHYAIDMEFLFAVLFSDRNLAFVEN